MSLLGLGIKYKPYKKPEYYPIGIPDFYLFRIEPNLFEFRLKTPISQTGSSIDTIYYFPFHHILHEIHLKHTDSAGAESTDSMDIAIYKDIGGSWQKLFGRTAYTGTYIDGEDLKYKNPARRYKFTTKTTNTDLLELKMLVEVLSH